MLQPTSRKLALWPRSGFIARVVMSSVAIALFSAAAFSQARDRITQSVDESSIFTLRGAVPPQARAEHDRGPVAASMKMERMTLTLKPSTAQQESLKSFLEQQQDPAFPNYHKWLTPEEYAERFGVSENDFNKVVSWLEQQGFTVVERSRSRTWIAFNGTAAQAAAAFHTEIHKYVVNGEERYANATAPAVPAALANVVQGIKLNDFRPRSRVILKKKQAKPGFTSSISGNHFLAPDDFATIYDLQSLYSNGVDGSGQKIAIVGQTNVNLSDIDTFRSVSNLQKNDPQLLLVPGSSDPGVLSSDIGEADLDIEWAGAVARNATMIYVYSTNVFDSLQYTVSQDLAPVISISYGDCEANFSQSEINSLVSLGQQANAQGQTIVAASGDTGAADCDYPKTATSQVTSATHGLAVDVPASLASVTGVGGSEFNEGSGTYWNTTNNASNGSAISYIPEIAWNDTTFQIANGGSLSASGGGVSTLFSKPAWQSGTGVPADSQRDVPDVSLTASADHDGYLICSQGSCVNGYRRADNTLTVFGGTSAGAPTFAGIVTLLNQKNNSAIGNVNPTLYTLAGSTPSAFHDITSGDNKVPCTAGSPNCPSGGGSIGYSAGTGYDLATGLGSPDAYNLLTAVTQALPPNFQIANTGTSSSLTLTHGGSPGSITFSVKGQNGFASPVNLTCIVSSTLGGTACAMTPASLTPDGTATLTVTPPATLSSLPRSRFGWEAGTTFVFLAGLWISSCQRQEEGGKKRRRLLWNVLSILTLITFVGAIVACGGGGSSSKSNTTTPPPPVVTVTSLSGTVTVQASSGNITHAISIPVTVN